MTFQIPIPQQDIAAFCKQWNVKELSLFGSVLRDDFQPAKSDIDVLIDYFPENQWSLFDLVEMQTELEQIFKRPVDLITRGTIERSHNMIRKQAILGSAEVIHYAEQ